MRVFNKIKLHKNLFKFADKPISNILVILLLLSFLGSIDSSTIHSSNTTNDQMTNTTPLQDENPQKNRSLQLSESNAPVILQFADDITFIEGATGNLKLRWKIDDLDNNEHLYLVYKNGSQIQSGTYDANVNLDVILDGTERGYYNYTIIANDTFGNFVTDTAYVLVNDTTIPMFDLSPLNFNITHGSFGNTISWTVSDLHPRNYKVLRNNTDYANSQWNSSIPISINIDFLDFGMHNFTIEAFDDSDNSVNDSVIVLVQDKASPVVITSPTNITFPFTTFGNNLIVNATDSHPHSYHIFEDSVDIFIGIWSNDELITWNLDYLIYGNYSFSILLIDKFTNNITITIDVFVILLKDTVMPQITITPIVHEGDYETISSQWKDVFDEGIIDANVTISLLSNGNISTTNILFGISDVNGNFEIVLNYTGIPIGDYQWQVKFEAKNFISQELLLHFNILAHNYKIIVSELTDLTQGEIYHIMAIIQFANSPSSLNLNALYAKSGPAANLEVDLALSATLTDGTLWIFNKTEVSNNNGELDFVLNILDTSLIASVNSISLKTVGNEYGNSMTIDVPIVEFPQIINSDGTINTTTSDTNIPSEKSISEILNDTNTILFGSIILFLSLLIIIFRRNRKKVSKKNLDVQGELNIVLTELSGLATLQLIILTSTTGIPLYEKQLKTTGINSVLLSGVTSAISALLQEANDQQIFGIEVMENRGLSITSHKSKHSSLVFISSSTLPMVILSQMIDSHDVIEKKYGDNLISGVGHIFQNDDFEELFEEKGLKLGLAGKLKIDLDKLETFISKSKNSEKRFANTLFEISEQEAEILNSNELLKILEKKGYPKNLSASYILNAYEHEIIY